MGMREVPCAKSCNAHITTYIYSYPNASKINSEDTSFFSFTVNFVRRYGTKIFPRVKSNNENRSSS